MTERHWCRAPGVVWRAAPDRVLVRRVGDRSEACQADLLGPGALLWLCLDRPATWADIDDRLRDAGIDASQDVSAALDELVASGWVVPGT